MSGSFETVIADAVEAALVRWRGSMPAARPVHAVAVGWTTVELARAEASVGDGVAGVLGPFEDAPGDAIIGAHVRVAAFRLAAVPTVRALALLEPSREGRLALSLARLGEGPAVVWMATDATAGTPPGTPADVASTSARGHGPFGPERLLLDGERDGRLVLVMDDAPGTIAT